MDYSSVLSGVIQAVTRAGELLVAEWQRPEGPCGAGDKTGWHSWLFLQWLLNVSLKERATLMHKESGHTALDEMRSQWRLMTVYERFEQVVAITLSGVMSMVIVISLIQLIRLVFTLLVMDALNPLDHKVFQLVFGATMTLLIAMEFKHSIVKVALRKESIIQVKTVILIAILALARKFIILDPDVDPAKVAALAGTILALGLTYWLMRERDDRKSE